MSDHDETRRVIARPAGNAWVHHRPDPDAGEDDPRPACGGSNRSGTTWQYRKMVYLPPRLTPCKACKGKPEPDCSEGWKRHVRFANTTPEDLGLDPWPPEPDADPETPTPTP